MRVVSYLPARAHKLIAHRDPLRRRHGKREEVRAAVSSAAGRSCQQRSDEWRNCIDQKDFLPAALRLSGRQPDCTVCRLPQRRADAGRPRTDVRPVAAVHRRERRTDRCFAGNDHRRARKCHNRRLFAGAAERTDRGLTGNITKKHRLSGAFFVASFPRTHAATADR